MKTSLKQGGPLTTLWTSIAVGVISVVAAAVGCGQVIGVDDWTPSTSGQGGQGGDSWGSSRSSSAAAAGGGSASTGGNVTAASAVSSTGPGSSSSSSSGPGSSASSTGVSASSSASSSVASTGSGIPMACMTTADCGIGLTCCDHICVNTGNDILNCGGCGVDCPATKPFCNGSFCDAVPCDPQMPPVCLGTQFCCGTQCCAIGKLCCDVPGPGPVTGLKCVDAVDGTCPIGCPACN